jgi:hypothetical protein
LAPQHAQTASSILANVGENSARKFFEFLQMRAGVQDRLRELAHLNKERLIPPKAKK